MVYQTDLGFVIAYETTRKEWNGLFVGKDEFEPKHPQIDLRVKQQTLKQLKMLDQIEKNHLFLLFYLTIHLNLELVEAVLQLLQ